MRALAQAAETTPDANSPAVESTAVPAKPVIAPSTALPAHRFFDRSNSLALAAVAASLAGDGWSTQRALTLPNAREMNPVARLFVTSRMGESAYSGASFALVTGGMYLAHRTNHHRWEKIGPFALAAWEGLLTAWNLHEISRAHAGR